MRALIVSLPACLAVGLGGLYAAARADEAARKDDPAKELAAIQKDWQDAQQAFFKDYQEAKTNEERQKVLKQKRPKPDAFAERCLKLADAHPDSPAAVEALAWVVGTARGTDAATKALPRLKEKLLALTDMDQLQRTLTRIQTVAPATALRDLAPQVAEKARKNLDHKEALPLLLWVGSATLYGGSPELTKLYNDTVDLLVERFVERPELAPLPGWLQQDDDPPWAEKHLRRLMDKNSSPEIKAQAKYGLAVVLTNKDEASQAEAEKLWNRVIDELQKKPGGPAPNPTLEQARKALKEMKIRGLGRPAPEISGEDIDGKPFKLSDYKGKVVLLDFWGNW
jgi:hypothetical protein